MFGGQVDFMDSNMLGLQDRRGQYIVVRCASHKAAREWEAALAFHTREEFCSTFLRPSPTIPKAGSIIVVDLGGASIRAGLCGPQPALTRLYFPSLMAASPSTPTEKYFGFDALKPEVRANCVLSNPLLPSSKVDKYSVDLVALCGLLLRVFKDLKVDPKKHELQLSVPRCFNDKTKAAIASLLFDEFEVAAVNMGHQTTFALQSYGTDTGIVVDLGERLEVVPIVGGYKLAAGISRTATGGGEMGGHLRQALLGRNYSLTSQLEGYVVRQVLENLCYVAESYHEEVDRCQADPASVERSVPVSGGGGLEKMAIAECSLDVRREVTQSIFLSGGLTMLPGFKQRLEAELEKLLPARPRVHASPHRQHAAFMGAQAHALSPGYQASRIRRQDWVSGAAKNTASLWAL